MLSSGASCADGCCRPSHKPHSSRPSGHAGLGLYHVLEALDPANVSAASLFQAHGVHAHKDRAAGIPCSSGSLGCGITIAVGFALGNPDKHVYVLCSDGECAEGSVWEARGRVAWGSLAPWSLAISARRLLRPWALRFQSLAFIHKHKLSNISVFVNANGYAAYDEVDVDNLEVRWLDWIQPLVVLGGLCVTKPCPGATQGLPAGDQRAPHQGGHALRWRDRRAVPLCATAARTACGAGHEPRCLCRRPLT